MGYIFPYQVEQIKTYQERLIPLKKGNQPLPLDNISKLTNHLKGRKREGAVSGHPLETTSVFEEIYSELTGTGKYVNKKV